MKLNLAIKPASKCNECAKEKKCGRNPLLNGIVTKCPEFQKLEKQKEGKNGK